MTSLDNAYVEPLPSIVLFVGAQADTFATYAAFFEASGLWVATAADPAEALAAVQDLKPDLVITDEFDAEVDLVQALKDTAETEALPVILLSRRPLVDVALASRERADMCLERPVLADALLQTSRALIDEARASRARGGDARHRTIRAPARTVEVVRSADAHETRRCPGCASPLEWIERGRLYGIEYDYYRWCPTGCGLYCYDCGSQAWVKLV